MSNSYQYDFVSFHILSIGKERPIIPLFLCIDMWTDFFVDFPAKFTERINGIVIVGLKFWLIKQNQ